MYFPNTSSTLRTHISIENDYLLHSPIASPSITLNFLSGAADFISAAVIGAWMNVGGALNGIWCRKTHTRVCASAINDQCI